MRAVCVDQVSIQQQHVWKLGRMRWNHHESVGRVVKPVVRPSKRHFIAGEATRHLVLVDHLAPKLFTRILEQDGMQLDRVVSPGIIL